MTVREFGRLHRIGPDRVRAEIAAGRLRALDLGQHGRPRYVILPRHAEEWERARQVSPPPAPKPARRKKRTYAIDYYPD
jgi:hypothetical protein